MFKGKSLGIGMAEGTIVLVSLVCMFCAGIAYSNSKVKIDEYETIVPKVSPKRTEQFSIVGNTWVNDAIDELESQGWDIVNVKAFSEANQYGFYDVLITYR